MVFVNFVDGYTQIVREDNDEMGFNGLAEIFICLLMQYPKLSK